VGKLTVRAQVRGACRGKIPFCRGGVNYTPINTFDDAQLLRDTAREYLFVDCSTHIFRISMLCCFARMCPSEVVLRGCSVWNKGHHCARLEMARTTRTETESQGEQTSDVATRTYLAFYVYLKVAKREDALRFLLTVDRSSDSSAIILAMEVTPKRK